MLHGSGNPRFRDDDGSADPAVAAALAAFAAAQGSEHAALTALSGARFLVPVVAVLADDDATEPGPATGGSADGSASSEGGGADGGAGGEKNSEMAMPTLVGRDGRAAIPVFTGVDALTRWQPAARPVPAEASGVWQAAVQDSCAVIIDVAGPVPLAVEGARLTALANGQPVPLPHEDPDVRDTVAWILAQAAAARPPASGQARFKLHPPQADGDLLVEILPPPGLNPAEARAFATEAGSAILDRLGTRLRRGIAIAVGQP